MTVMTFSGSPEIGIQEMAEALRELHEADQLSKWEMSFMSNIYALLDQEEDLSDAQIDKVTEIYKEYIDDNQSRRPLS